jgi:hypothetical protein
MPPQLFTLLARHKYTVFEWVTEAQEVWGLLRANESRVPLGNVEGMVRRGPGREDARMVVPPGTPGGGGSAWDSYHPILIIFNILRLVRVQNLRMTFSLNYP